MGALAGCPSPPSAGKSVTWSFPGELGGSNLPRRQTFTFPPTTPKTNPAAAMTEEGGKKNWLPLESNPDVMNVVRGAVTGCVGVLPWGLRWAERVRGWGV